MTQTTMKELVEKGLIKLGEYRDSVERVLHPHRKHRFRKIPDLTLPHPSKEHGESLDIRGYAQLDGYSCGAIAGWTILSSIHPDSSWEEFYARCSPSAEIGVYDAALLKALRAFGIGVRTKQGGMTFEAIKKAIESGFPILTSVKRLQPDTAHWIVVYGYSETNKPRSQMVYVAGNNFMGLHTEKLGGHNPLPYREFAKLSKAYNSYVCWGA
jgi:hypothetical protein